MSKALAMMLALSLSVSPALAAEPLVELPWGSGPGEVGFYNTSTPGFDQPYAEGPGGLAVAPDGRIWISDTFNDRLLEVSSGGQVVRTLTKLGDEVLKRPKALFVRDGRLVVVNDGTTQLLSAELATGKVQRLGRAGQGAGSLSQPELFGVSMEQVCVQDDWRNELVCFLGDGREAWRQKWPLGGVAMGARGRVYTAAHENGGWSLVSTDRSGVRTAHYALVPPDAALTSPSVVSVDADGGAVVRFARPGPPDGLAVVRYDARGRVAGLLGETRANATRQSVAVAPDGRVLALSFDATVAPRGRVRVVELR